MYESEEWLPERSARWLFADMNAFFATCEQQEKPELRGKPVGIVPLLADNACVIASSYEAKALGVKTGLLAHEARRICPTIHLQEANPKIYLDYHRQLEVLFEEMFPEPKALSVDEIACRLWANERSYSDEVNLARRLKRRIHDEIGEYMSCSVGLAPNCWLAKVSASLQKPNGLVLMRQEDLPHALASLKLTDLPGIARRMHKRLAAHGIHTVEQLYQAPRHVLKAAWGGVVGERWWFMLRGFEQADYSPLSFYGQGPQNMGHSHVLGPNMRRLESARQIMMRLTMKAVDRMRRRDYMAQGLYINLELRNDQTFASITWGAKSEPRRPSGDHVTWLGTVNQLWDRMPVFAPGFRPLHVSMVLTRLLPRSHVTGSLFEEDRRPERVSDTIDSANRRFGQGSVGLLSAYAPQWRAPERISFGKV